MMEMDFTITEIVVGGTVLFLVAASFLCLAIHLSRKRGAVMYVLALLAHGVGLVALIVLLVAISVNVFDSTLNTLLLLVFTWVLTLVFAIFFPHFVSSRRGDCEDSSEQVSLSELMKE